MENRGPGVRRKEGDTGHLDICQPLMKEFNLVENLKQPCLTGGLTDFSSLRWRVLSLACATAHVGVILEVTIADTCHSAPPPSTTLRNAFGKNIIQFLRQLSVVLPHHQGAKESLLFIFSHYVPEQSN